MKKGHTNNPNGRPKGKPNKITGEVRDWIKQIIDNNREQLERDLNALEPKDRWVIIEKLMAYTIPKLQSVETKIDFASFTDEQLDQIVTEILNRENNEN